MEKIPQEQHGFNASSDAHATPSQTTRARFTLRIQDASDWTGARVRLITNVPALGDAAYIEALKMGLEPQVTTRYNGFRAIEFVGSDVEVAELLAELPAGLLEAAQVTPTRTINPSRRKTQGQPLSRAQEWERALALLQGGCFHA